jgi:hypothetical protein
VPELNPLESSREMAKTRSEPIGKMHRLTVYGQPVNMRLSFDGLYALTRNNMQQDPLSARLFANKGDC